MDFSVKRVAEGLSIPAAAFVISLSLAWMLSVMLRYGIIPQQAGPVMTIMAFLPYPVLLAGVILGWRYTITGLVLTSFFLMFVYYFYSTYGPPLFSKKLLAPAVCKASLIIFPLNIILFSLLTKRRIFATTGSLYLFLFALQFSIIALVFNPKGRVFLEFIEVIGSYSTRAHNLFVSASRYLTIYVNSISLFPCVLMYMWTIVFLVTRYIYKRDISLAGFTGVFATAMSGMLFSKSAPVIMIYFLAAGGIIIASVIESAFVMEKEDALTGLPSRKGLGEFLEYLKGTYAVALIDIDHFSRFNEDYGSVAGDDVLKTVSEKLSDTVRGVRTLRYGGEQFIAIFPGMSTDEVVTVLDAYRKTIEAFPFLIKTKEKTTLILTGKSVRSDNAVKQAHITVSIGVAGSGTKRKKPVDSVKEADRALNYAKQSGRNRIVLIDTETGKDGKNLKIIV